MNVYIFKSLQRLKLSKSMSKILRKAEGATNENDR